MFFTAVDRLRTSFRPETSVMGVIPEGGTAPNIVPDRAVVDLYIRYPDEVYLAHVDSMIANAARGSALATGTQVEIQPYGSYRDGITLGTLQELQHAYARKLGAPRLPDEPGRPTGYEETGWVTRDIPGVQVAIASSNHPNHSYGMNEDNFTEVGHTGFLMDAKIQAAILYDFLTKPDFRRAVETEHKAMAALFDQYIQSLKGAYRDEIGRP